ncbi:Ada metal-binding domain-containing protein [Bacillus sp. cl95]|uniref:Ada metal-binding domain-containing protein n=2 Tax=unclassified Bacillus (in: firmicutes) TaxID=185979 RepID=UPI0008ED322A|nr:Ada metal-binding domain-containing protein [Bacillus sp. cl95]SFB07443.1 DNA-3-methyladenine glycosylase II [Bacillus sp. UNCCL13]
MMYKQILQKNKEYNGRFYTAVKTTKIYCVPSCPARIPNFENVEFFDNHNEAEAAGYRPCKKCFPQTIHIQWKNLKNHIEISTAPDFNFAECLVYLNRSDQECLHQVVGEKIYKLVQIEDYNVLLKINHVSHHLHVEFVNDVPPKWGRALIAKYVVDMFDLQTDLNPFYELANNDPILHALVEKYRGLRIIKINDLFECLTWAVIGQQINLKFAYTLKRRLVESYGDKVSYEGVDYYSFPHPHVIAELEIEDLKKLQFTTRKAEYVIGIAKLFVSGELNKKELLTEKDYHVLLNHLVSIRGIGHWTADYTIMKSFNLNCAFPIADVGIHNALKGILGLDKKPSIPEIQVLAKNWTGWESYAAFYLWRWLYD